MQHLLWTFHRVQRSVGNIKQTFGGVPSIAVNCAGIAEHDCLLDIDEESFSEILAVNLKVCFGSHY